MKYYATSETANQWYLDHGDERWHEFSQTERDAYLRKSCLWIDRHFSFRGHKLNPDQDRSWPRVDAYSDDGDAILGIPQIVIDATLTLLPAFDDGDEVAEAMIGLGRRIKQQKIGGVEMVYETSQKNQLSRIEHMLLPVLRTRNHNTIRRS